MSYEAASRKGREITRKAAETEAWCDAIEPLIELRDIMRLMFVRVDTVHPTVARSHAAILKLMPMGLRLERTNYDEKTNAGYQILRGSDVIAGAGFLMSLDDVEAFTAALK
jgi:hypothetical protein